MTSTETQIRDLYKRFGDHAVPWRNEIPLIAEAGFRILCGPPVMNGPMVVSLNPGLTKKVIESDGHDFWPQRWPEEISYKRGISSFSRKLADVLGKAGINLEEINAAYVLAFRSRSIREWKITVPTSVREQAEALSLNMLSDLVSILKPSFVYAAGFSTFRRMGCDEGRVDYGKRKGGMAFALLRYGTFKGIPVIASPHLSGARLTRENLDQISEALAVSFTS
jgi:hypothetical protein